MDKKAYRAAIAKLDLTQAAAGEMFGVGPRTSRRWALGEARVPPLVAMLLELMVSKKIMLELNIPASAERSPERHIWTFQATQAVQALE